MAGSGETRAHSSVIAGAWYEPEARRLVIRFANGRRYAYAGVPPDVAEGFARAESKGSFFNAAIRDSFAATPLAAGTAATARRSLADPH